MNPNNYGSQPACQRLADAGIVLETELWWTLVGSGYGDDWQWQLSFSNKRDYLSPNDYQIKESYPAPSMTEVWRELQKTGRAFQIETDGAVSHTREIWDTQVFTSTNPTDALIDLLIWVRQRRETK